ERDVFLAGGSGFLGMAARLAVSAVFAAPFVPVFIPAVVPVLAEAGGAVSVAFAPAAFEAALRPGPATGVLPAGIARRRRMPPAMAFPAAFRTAFAAILATVHHRGAGAVVAARGGAASAVPRASGGRSALRALARLGLGSRRHGE